MAFVKLTTEDCIHNGYQYKEGLNCLNGEFNNEKICDSGGLYFCRKEDIGKWCTYGFYKIMYYIWDVELCEDSKIVDMGDKLKTDKFIIKNKRTIWDNEEICKLAVQYNGYLLQYVNQKVMTYEICKLAVQQNYDAFKYVKPELMTDEICKLAVSKNGYAIQIIKPELMTDEICKLAVRKNGEALQYVKPELMTEEICKLAVQKNGNALKYVKPELMTDEICKLAVQQNGYALKYVKPEFMTNKICKLAVQQNPDSKCYVKKTKNKLRKIISLSLIVGSIGIGLGILHYRKKLCLSK
jgi:hypothetical protein